MFLRDYRNPVCDGRGFIDLSTNGSADCDGHLSHVHGGQEDHVGGEAASHKESDETAGGQHTHLQVVDEIVQQLQITFMQLADPTADGFQHGDGLLIDTLQLILLHLVGIQQHVAQNGDPGQCNDHGGEDQEGNGKTEVVKQHTRDTAGEADGQEDSRGGQGGGQNGGGDFLGAFHAGSHAVVTVGSIAVDVFQNHDGVIHDHTHTHGDAAQTHHVHSQIAHIHQDKGGQGADGHGDCNGQSGAPAAQEQEHHDTCQQHAGQNAADGGIDSQVDKVRSQIGDAVMDVSVLGSQLFHLSGNGLSRGVFIGTGLLGDLQNDAVFAVHLGDCVRFHGFQIDIGHFAQTDCTAGGQGDDHVGNIVNALEFGVRTDGQGPVAVVQVAAGEQQVLCSHVLDDVAVGKTISCRAGGIHIHGDLLCDAAADRDGSDAVDALQCGNDHIFRQSLGLSQIVTDQCYHGCWQQITEIHVDDDGVYGAVRQGQKFKFFAQLGCGDIQIRALGIGDLDLADTVRGGGGDAFHAGNRQNSCFQRAGDHVLHITGGGAVIVAHDNRHGSFHIGKQGHLQAGGKHHAEHRDHDDG